MRDRAAGAAYSIAAGLCSVIRSRLQECQGLKRTEGQKGEGANASFCITVKLLMSIKCFCGVDRRGVVLSDHKALCSRVEGSQGPFEDIFPINCCELSSTSFIQRQL